MLCINCSAFPLTCVCVKPAAASGLVSSRWPNVSVSIHCPSSLSQLNPTVPNMQKLDDILLLNYKQEMQACEPAAIFVSVAHSAETRCCLNSRIFFHLHVGFNGGMINYPARLDETICGHGSVKHSLLNVTTIWGKFSDHVRPISQQ